LLASTFRPLIGSPPPSPISPMVYPFVHCMVF
jgi:hypothetical protein